MIGNARRRSLKQLSLQYHTPTADAILILSVRFMTYKNTTERVILRPQQVCKDCDLFHVQPFLGLIFRSNDFDLDPVDALRQACFIHMRLQKAILLRIALRQADVVDGDEHLIGPSET